LKEPDMVFKGGQVVATKVGAMTKTKLAEWVGEHTDGGNA